MAVLKMMYTRNTLVNQLYQKPNEDHIHVAFTAITAGMCSLVFATWTQVNRQCHVGVGMLNILAEASSEPLITNCPSGLRAKHCMPSEWPEREYTHSPAHTARRVYEAWQAVKTNRWRQHP